MPERRLRIVRNDDPVLESQPAAEPVWGNENIDKIVDIVRAYDEEEQGRAGQPHSLTRAGRRIIDWAAEALKW